MVLGVILMILSALFWGVGIQVTGKASLRTRVVSLAFMAVGIVLLAEKTGDFLQVWGTAMIVGIPSILLASITTWAFRRLNRQERRSNSLRS